MDWLTAIGSISGIVALLGLVFATGKYCTKIDSLWEMKDNLSAVIVKVDTLWHIYIEDSLIRHSNPGGEFTLPDELKADIRKLLDNEKYFQQIKEPTLLIVARIGVRKFSEVARNNGTDLGQVLATVNSFVFDCLKG